jgi:hypothetical protein
MTQDDQLRFADALAEKAEAYIRSGIYTDGPEPADALEREVYALDQFKRALNDYYRARGRSSVLS